MKSYEIIGSHYYYETMIFEAQYETPYWDIDVTKRLILNLDWQIDYISRTADKAANEMHEQNVIAMIEHIESGNYVNLYSHL